MLGEMSVSGHRSYKCGAVYDRSEHIVEVRKISSFQYAVCGETIESRSSVPRYRFIACPVRDAEWEYPKRPRDDHRHRDGRGPP
jgi:hypothetical protein